MKKPDFTYTTYIKSTPEKVWEAITNPEFTRQYWGHDNLSDWKTGSDWSLIEDNGQEKICKATGKVIESHPPKRLVLTWFKPDKPKEDSRVTFDIEYVNGMVRLDIVHGQFVDGSDLADKISMGWPLVLSNLKTMLETGTAFNLPAVMRTGCGGTSIK